MIKLPDPDWETYDKAIADAYLRAVNEWLEEIQPRLDPHGVLTAAAGDESMPILEVLLTSLDEWLGAVGRHITPLIAGIMARRLADIAHEDGLLDAKLDDASQLTISGDIDLEAILNALEAAGITTAGVEPVLRFPDWQWHIREVAETTPNKVARMPEEIYRHLVRGLAKNIDESADAWDRILFIREHLAPGAPYMRTFEQWASRAERIARTEATRAINQSDIAATREIQDITGEQLDKVWLSTIDDRTRETHWEADGRRVPIDEKFTIGGHECDYPGDPALPPEESVNCRCTLIYLEPDEDLPGEEDRQTERERSDGTTRDLEGEVERRAKEGQIRDRDIPDIADLVAAATERTPNMAYTTWSGLLAPLGTPTVDGRIIDRDAKIDYRELPLPLLWQESTEPGHDRSVIVGKITTIDVADNGVRAAGVLFDTEPARKAANLIDEGVLRPSVDLGDVVAEWSGGETTEDGDESFLDDTTGEDEVPLETITRALVLAATLVSVPAFSEAVIKLGEGIDDPDSDDEEDNLDAPGGEEETEILASAAALVDTRGHVVDRRRFDDPKLTGPTPLVVTDDGYVFGHLAVWGSEHVGMPGRRVTPPHSQSGYAHFHTSTIETTDGRLPVGRLTAGGGHAAPTDDATAAAAHYDDVATTWAFVRAGEDQHGIWVAGQVNPDADEKTIRQGATASLSGDWRQIGGNLELVAALSVNTPGFPIPRSFSARPGERQSLTAAGALPVRDKRSEQADMIAEGIRRYHLLRDAEEKKQRGRRARSLRARMLKRRVARHGRGKEGY